MQMLTKFESKSNRVKGISFHPKRPWILASLHNGCIQLWDYRMGTLVERFEEHQGSVRGIAFHSTQPLFVSGGDDYKVRVWNYKTKKCLFTLNGHMDYVRTVYFHHEYPWIISASDDQTIRIWNWQSRKCIALLTGHNHYVMSAQFHPTLNYIVSASMDQTIRVWDISGLVKKNRATPGTMPFTDNSPFGRGSPQIDRFGISDINVKYVLEGHDRGVNWATFHPTMPLILSGGDDRQVKLWRMSETKAWEVDSFRGSSNNVWGAIFHPRQDLIISAGEDKAIRIWDLTKRTPVTLFKRPNDRFWILASHPTLNLLAAGHDNGMIVFKLERERPAFQMSQNRLYYISKKTLWVQDYSSTTEASSRKMLNISKLGTKYAQPRTLSHNPAENAILVTTTEDGGLYELYKLPKNTTPSSSNRALDEPYNKSMRGAGYKALFIARNRFAIFDKVHQQIEIRDLSNTVIKLFKTPVTGIIDIFYAGTGSLLLTTATHVMLFDIQQQRISAESAVSAIKYVIWSNDYSMAALLSKHTITLVDKGLKQISQLYETIRIKSGVWDESGVFLYCTLNHIKYALLEGDNGIIRTLDQPVYMTSVKGKSLFALDRQGKPVKLTIDLTEFRFKLALTQRKYEEVFYIIQNANLVGQAIISYLQQKGYPEIALHFVRDQSTRFELALQCGNLDIALESAQKLDTRDNWEKLGSEALRQGNFKMVELAYQHNKSYDRLSFLYLTSGNKTKLQQMLKIAQLRGDPMSRFQNAMYLGDVAERVQLLQDVGQLPLAYMTAKSHGLDDQAQAILAAAGKTKEAMIELPFVDSINSSRATHATSGLLKSMTTFLEDYNWPLLTVSRSFFEGAFAVNNNNNNKKDQNNTAATLVPSFVYDEGFCNIEDAGGDWSNDNDNEGNNSLGVSIMNPSKQSLDSIDDNSDKEEGGGWEDNGDIYADITAEISNVAAKETAEFVAPVARLDETTLWVQTSPLAADHISAGSFDTAMQILNRQVGAVNFSLLKSHFLAIYQASRISIPSNAASLSLSVYLRRDPDTTTAKSGLPIIAYSFQTLVSLQLQLAYKYFTSGKLLASASQFKNLLHALLFTIVSSKTDADEASQLVYICREYIMGLAIEHQRRSTTINTKRTLELTAYFTHCRLQTPHLQLALRQAAKQAFRLKNFNTASQMCTRLLELAPPKKIADEARQIQAVCQKSLLRDEVQLDYDQYNPFVVCGISFEPIYKGSSKLTCPFCQASYKPEFQNRICTVCEVSQIGLAGSGFRVMI